MASPAGSSSTGKKTVGKYEIGKTLGEGTFGKVKYAVNIETGEEVAIKVLDKERIAKQSMGTQIKKEISIMKQLEHPNIVKLKEVLASRTKIFIVLELVTGGELFDLIVKSGRLEENEARYYFRQLVEGVAYCHSKGVAHRDLKPENLLLDASGTLKISDFGLSALYDDPQASRSELLHTTCGTPNYVAPEVLQNLGYDGKRADCWSVGVVLYVLLAGFLPFDETTMSALFAKIKAADFGYPHWFSKPVLGLLDSLLVPDPASRASLTELLAHPWVAAPITLPLKNKANSSPPTKPNSSSSTEDKNVENKIISENTKTKPPVATAPTQPPPPSEKGKSPLESGTLNKHESSRQVSLASRLAPVETIDTLEKALRGDERLQQLARPEQSSLEASIVTASGLVSLSATATASVKTSAEISSTDDTNEKSSSPENLPVPAAHLCITRGKGDILAYAALYSSLLNALSPILTARASS